VRRFYLEKCPKSGAGADYSRVGRGKRKKGGGNPPPPALQNAGYPYRLP
jgi:hypothetical protein